MPRAKGKKKDPEPEIYLERTQASSVVLWLGHGRRDDRCRRRNAGVVPCRRWANVGAAPWMGRRAPSDCRSTQSKMIGLEHVPATWRVKSNPPR